MIRILIIAILVVVLYRLVIGKPVLGSGNGPQARMDQNRDGDFVDYEEVDEEDPRR